MCETYTLYEILLLKRRRNTKMHNYRFWGLNCNNTSWYDSDQFVSVLQLVWYL